MTAAAPHQLLPAYLVVGADELKRSAMLKRLRSRLDGDLAEFNLDELHGASLEDPATLVSSLQTMPFGTDFRLVIVHEAEALAKPLSEAVVTYLSDPNPSCVLCLDAEKLAKNTRLYKAVAKVGAKAVIDCSPPKRWELPPHVAKLAERHGKRMGIDAAEELVSRCGESMTMLDNQVAALAALVGDAPDITLADVEANVAQTAEVSPWAFLDAVCERNAVRALELYRLMDRPSLVWLHSILVGRLRELICAKSLEARGSLGSLGKELGRQAWQVKNHGRWIRRFIMDELLACLDEACRCERMVKGTGDEETAFLELVLHMATPSR